MRLFDLPDPTPIPRRAEKQWTCGCVTTTRLGGPMTIEPCADDCPVYLIAMEECRRANVELVVER